MKDEPTISEAQADLIAYGLVDIVREFMKRPGERERFEAWRKERGHLYREEATTNDPSMQALQAEL